MASFACIDLQLDLHREGRYAQEGPKAFGPGPLLPVETQRSLGHESILTPKLMHMPHKSAQI